MEKQRKKRKLNLTVSETNILRSKVAESLDILKSKFTNRVTNKRKNKIWDDITNGDKCARGGERNIARS